MFKDITLGQYFPGNSVIHRLDPRIKLLWVLFYIILLFFIKNALGFALYIAVTLAVIFMTRIKFYLILKGVKPILFLLVFTSLINIFMTGETPIFKMGFLTVTREGIIFAVFMALRLVLLVIGTSILTLTTSPIMLTDGIERLLAPFSKIGLPAHAIAMMMTIALRFIPTIMEETDKIIKAQSARGADFESGNILKRAKALTPLLIPLFISAFRRADDLATAMECRGYHGGEGRTRLRELKMAGIDYTALSVMPVFLAGIIFLNQIQLWMVY